MRRSGTFALAAGVLGFVVDAIALAAFIRAAPGSGSFTGSAPRVWSIVLLVYGWFVVSWVIAKRRIASGTKTEEITIVGFAVGAIGLLLLPLAMVIGYDIFKEARAASAIDPEVFTQNVVLGSLITMGAIGSGIFLAIMFSFALIGDE